MNLLYTDESVQKFNNQATAILSGNVNRFQLKQYKENLKTYMKLDIAGIEEKESKFRQALQNYAAKYRKDHEKEYSEKRRFFDLKNEIQRDELFPILQKMPKGGLLHVHSAAGLSYERLLLLCTEWNSKQTSDNNKIVVNIRPHTPRLAQYTLMFKYQEQWLRDRKIQPISMELSEFLKIGRNAKVLKKALCIVKEIKDTASVWKEFNIKYSRFNMLLENKEFFEKYHYEFFNECSDDNISYVELRTGLVKFIENTGEEIASDNFGEHVLRSAQDFNVENYLQHIEDAITVQNGEVTKNTVEFLLSIDKAKKDAGIDVKVILTANRGTDPVGEADKLKEKIDFAINIKNGTNIGTSITIEEKEIISNLVIGFDFVNQEDTQYATCAYKNIMYENTNKPGQDLRTRMQDINFYLHDGESNWKQAPSVKYGGIRNKDEQIPNIIAGCICSAYRIGHGLTMVQYPELIDAICCGVGDGAMNRPTDDNLILPAVEINPISNQLLKYQEDLRLHPVFQLLKSGINCVMGNDDPLIFDNPGLSYDFWMLIMDSEITYDMIKQIVFMGYVFRILNEQKKLLTPDLEKIVLQDAHDRFCGKWAGFLISSDVETFVKKYEGI